MKSRVTYIITSVIFVGMLATPTIFALFGVSSGSLTGKSDVIPDVSLSIPSYLNGSWQQYAERTFEKRSGLRSILIRSDNQLNFSLFNQLSSKYDANVILGNNNSVLERGYLADVNRIYRPNISKLEKITNNLTILRDKLKSQGKDLLILISPSKLAFNPEVLRPEWRVPGSESRANSYHEFVPMLEAAKVPFFDSPKFFSQLPAEQRELVFSRGGTHWSSYGSCMATAELLNRLAAGRGVPMATIECPITGNLTKPRSMDKDILSMANLLFPNRLLIGARHPEVKPIIKTPDGAQWPKIFVEGTSFCWSILSRLEKAKVSSALNFLYYARTFYSYPGKIKKSSVSTSNEWQDSFHSADIIIIEINQATVEELGHGLFDLLAKKFN